MIAILKREIKSFFVTPIFYVFITMFLILSAIFFWNSGIIQQQIADITGFFQLMPLALMFLIPVLTMRCIADEKKSKTDQLLFTAPVNTWKIVLGKYFAAVFVFVITMLSTIVYPIILYVFGNPATAPIVSHYIGYILYGATLIAIGIYISSLTENQFIAAVVSFGIFFVLNFLEIVGVLSGSIRVANFIGFISLQRRFEYFHISVLNLSSIVYFLLIATLFVFLTIQRLNRKRVG